MFRGKCFAIVGVILTLVMLRISWGEDIPVKGKVVDATGKPVAGAQVYACQPDETSDFFRDKIKILAEVKSDDAGAFGFPSLRIPKDDPRWYLTVYAVKPGFAYGCCYFSSGRGAGEAEIVLAPASKVAGRVLDADGKPIRGARAEARATFRYKDRPRRIYSPRGLSFLSATTDKRGAFVVESLPLGGQAFLHVEAAGFAGEDMGWVPNENQYTIPIPKEGVEVRLGRESVIKGVLRWEKTGKPVAGIALYCYGRNIPGASQKAVTDANGAFEARGLRAGEYTFMHYPSLQRSSDTGGLLVPAPPVKVGKGETVENVALTWGEGIIVEGKVLDAKSRQPVDRADVTLFSGQATGALPFVTSGSTDAKGAFRLRAVPGAYNLNVREKRHSYYQKPLSVAEGRPVALGDVLLEPNPEFVVQVKDEAGKPAPKARIVLSGVGGEISDEKGCAKIQIDPLLMGERALWRRAVVFSEDSTLGGVLDIPEKAGPIEVILRPCGAVSGVVRQSDGKPIPGATVEVGAVSGTERGFYFDGQSLLIPEATTDAVGRFTITGLPPGQEYGLNVKAKGFGAKRWNSREKKYAVAPGATVQAEPITLVEAKGVVSGRVVDPTGAPIEGITVNLYGRSPSYADYTEGRVRTDADGRFKIENVVPGEVGLRAETYESDYSPFSTTIEPEKFENIQIVLYPKFKASETLSGGAVAPELKGVEWIQGEWKGFEAMRGKRVAIAFVSIKNRACRKAIADLQTERNRVSDRNLVSAGTQVVLVHDASATAEEIKQFLAEKKIAWPTARVTDEKNNGWFSPAFVAYKVTSVPTVVWVGADGKIQRGAPVSRR